MVLYIGHCGVVVYSGVSMYSGVAMLSGVGLYSPVCGVSVILCVVTVHTGFLWSLRVIQSLGKMVSYFQGHESVRKNE